VAELVDAPDLGSGGENRGGSSPSARTSAAQAGFPKGRYRFSDKILPEGTQGLADFVPLPAIGHGGGKV
jgi:hypothetical protein